MIADRKAAQWILDDLLASSKKHSSLTMLRSCVEHGICWTAFCNMVSLIVADKWNLIADSNLLRRCLLFSWYVAFQVSPACDITKDVHLSNLPQQCNDLMSVHLWNAYKLSEKTCHHVKPNTFDEFEGRCSQISSSVRKWASLSTNLLASPNKCKLSSVQTHLAPCTFWAHLGRPGNRRWIEQGKEDLMLLSNL